MARHKAQNWPWMLKHVTIYTAIVAVVLVIYALIHRLPAWAVVAAILSIFGTHLALDRRHFTLWWMRQMGMAPDHPWLSVAVDQVFHVLTLAVVAQLLLLVQP